MTESTLPPPLAGASPPQGALFHGGRRAERHRLAAPAAVVGLLLAATAIVLWAGTRPGFDPYGWLVWGHQTLSGTLNTNAAPSWKPLPYLFTVPFALFGHYELWLWMIVSVAVSLSGTVFAGRIAYRLTADRSDRRYAAVAAAAFAAFALLGIDSYPHYVLSAQSDPMIVALCLGAIDAHLSGRPRLAFALGALASLGRPEVWPFLGLYTIWCWRAIPSMRWLIGGGIAVLALLWFGIPALTSRSPFVAASNALGSGRALHSNKALGTIGRFLALDEPALELLALLSVCLALLRRDRVTLVLASGVVAWVIVEIGFALHGWPGLGRYMFEAGAVTAVLAGVAVGRLLSEPPRVSSLTGIAGVAIVVVAVATLVPAAVSRARSERADLRVQRERTAQINRLSGVVTGLGGPAALRGCGEPLTRLEYQTVLAWTLRVNVATVGFKYGPAVASGRPIVLFTPVGRSSWRVQAVHQTNTACLRLPG
ncbi:MAG: hypothetical protein M3018_00745 [Actinomycetota bacterium]|nr:hypothetical protein [Actinomycetota bacterium]